MAQASIDAGVRHVVAIDAEQSVLAVAAWAFAAHFYPALLSGRSVRQAFDYGRAMVLNHPEVQRACEVAARKHSEAEELARQLKMPNAAELLVRAELLKFKTRADQYDALIVNGQIELGQALFSLEFPNFEMFLEWGDDQWQQQIESGAGAPLDAATHGQQAFTRFLNDVIAGARGDAKAGQRAYQFAQSIQADASAQRELRAIAQACQRILEGLRGDDVLRDLPEEVKPLIVQLLEQIEG